MFYDTEVITGPVADNKGMEITESVTEHREPPWYQEHKHNGQSEIAEIRATPYTSLWVSRAVEITVGDT